jgi:hypothetical protein
MPSINGSDLPDSSMPLLRVTTPALLVIGDADPNCPEADLRSTAKLMGSGDVRLVVSQGVDGSFLSPGSSAISPELVTTLVTTILDYVTAVATDKLEGCGISRAKGEKDGAPSAAGAAALQAAHVSLVTAGRLSRGCIARSFLWVGRCCDCSWVIDGSTLTHPPCLHHPAADARGGWPGVPSGE